MITYVLLVVGLIVLVVGAEVLVRGAVVLAAVGRISPVVIGLTVVAFGTSAPELAVSAVSSLKGEADISLGNVVGSNVFNVLLILGASAMLVPLSVAPQLIRLDVPLMIAASVGVWLAAWNGVIAVWEASLMVICFVLYNAWLISQGSNDDTEVLEALHLPRSSNWRLITWNCLLALLGLGLLVVGARLLVDSATTIARTLGVSDIVIGLTIVAGGTSLPELATSLVAAIKGQRDIAVGNVVGSNIFNLLAVLSTASILSAEGLAVAPDVLWFDLTVMTLIAILCWPIFVSHLTISRGEGLVLLLLFFTYNSLLIADAIYKEKISHLNPVFTLGVLPLILLVSALHLWRSKQTGSPELSSD